MKHLQLLLLSLFFPLAIHADGWNGLYQQIEQSIRQPQFANRCFSIEKYGAKASTDSYSIGKDTPLAAANQKAINKAIETCSKAGGGQVIIPAGIYYTGAITMLSHVNLVMEKGATLQFVFEPDLYPQVLTRWEGLDCWNLSPCIYAYKQTDIAITGEGTIDGGGNRETWWPWCGASRYGWKEGMTSQKMGGRARLMKMAEDGVDMNDRRFTKADGLRPQLISPNQCDGVLIEGVTLLSSPFWVIHPLLCKNVTVRGVRINNDGPNGDGCDPESCDGVLIEHCFFNTGDDCIAIKSGRNMDGRLWNKPSENIIIRNCEMKNGHGGVVIGSEISGGCRNVFAENNYMDSPNLDRVVRIKTNTCRGGIVENIYVRNIEVGQCRESVLKINLDYESKEACCRGYLPTVRNVHLDSVNCQKSKYGVQIIALDTCTNVYDIYVNNCRFDGVAEGNYLSGKTRNVVYDNYYINGELALQQKPFKHYSEWMVHSEMKRVPQSYMLDFSKSPKWSYVMGIELEAMLDTYLKYGNDDILQYCQMYTDTMINAQGDIRGYRLEDYNLDQIRTGHFVTRMYEHHPEEKNLKAIETLMRQMEKQPRTRDGVYWHKAIYAYQVWLDGIFMGLPFRTLAASMLLKGKKAEKIYDDAVTQITKTYNRTLDPETGLNRHAWDETNLQFWADKSTGLSQHCWGRAQGWYTMALVELLDALPEDYSRRGEVIDLLKKDLDAVIRWQDKETGLWYQVMDSPERDGDRRSSESRAETCLRYAKSLLRKANANYLEATCSSMFAYALLKASRKGYVESRYREAGIKAYKGIINRFIRMDEDNTISLTQCCAVAGLGPGSTPVVEAAIKRIDPQGRVKTNRRSSESNDKTCLGIAESRLRNDFVKPNEQSKARLSYAMAKNRTFKKVKTNARRDGSYEYYLSEPIRDNDAKGIGPFIWASLEMEALGYDIFNMDNNARKQAKR